MTENKHTPEPWSVWGRTKAGPKGLLIEDQYGEAIAVVHEGGRDDEADARRICACINACAGMKTEELENYKREYVLGMHVADLVKQRDELLEALEKFIDSHEECTDFDGFTAQIVSMDDYHEAQEAIASVKENK